MAQQGWELLSDNSRKVLTSKASCCRSKRELEKEHTMKTPNTQDIRNAMRDATRTKIVPVSLKAVQNYTDRRANGRSRVAFLLYQYSESDVQTTADMANKILDARGFEPVVKACRSNTCYGKSYMKLVGTGPRA
jgi:phenylalanine-4-hydroxylase